MAKKQKVVDLKPKVDKIKQEHLDDLQKAVNHVNGLQFNIGRIEMQKHSALHDLAQGQDRITMLQEELIKEYGTYDVNLTDGTINWPENEK
tara:strand:+ start:315 stop:587 length:273 start_codon:yes stop_codon:yes gene_type:complete